MSLTQTADQDVVRRVNKSLVLNTLRLHAPISRAGVANLTGLNRSTVTHIVNALIAEGLVSEESSENEQDPGARSVIGRPSISLALRPDGGAVVGVEIGVDFISVVLTDFVAQPLWQGWAETDATKPMPDLLLQAEQVIDQAIREANQKQMRVLGIGVGLPGMVNVSQGELIFAPNLGWRNVSLRSMWAERFHLPIYVENEANLAALGEYYFGVAHSVENFIYLSSGVGLGGGMVVGGKLFRGGHGFAGEIGHMQRDPAGEWCGCGRRGCWETQVGPRAVVRRIQKQLMASPDAARPAGVSMDLHHLTLEMVVDAAMQGDPLCRSSIEEVAGHLGSGVADLINLFNPEMVVIGGALSLARELMLPVIQRVALGEALTASSQEVKILFSDRGKDACVYGAIAIVLDDILRELAIV